MIALVLMLLLTDTGPTPISCEPLCQCQQEWFCPNVPNGPDAGAPQ